MLLVGNILTHKICYEIIVCTLKTNKLIEKVCLKKICPTSVWGSVSSVGGPCCFGFSWLTKNVFNLIKILGTPKHLAVFVLSQKHI